MKIFKSMTAVALLMLGTAVMAQSPGNRQMRSATERAKMETERMVQALELSTDQAAKIQVINYTYAVKDSIRFADRRQSQADGVSPDRETMMKIMREDREAKATELKAVLTDAQKVKYEAMEKERAERFRNRQGGSGNRP